ncbi:bifunctional lysylphosphatidylglycerol flippase/synthetase MprF [Vitiosangium sp. GDMCC 1.1324]|uniref:bifunctional lysylphosphatidylglycerol flippase/synthetase MprF n=1 Tax=Vitiosangium sp. (strain GDMCC 1.1324) TaxID=2138576 RepID=UPI000D343D91|nr:bifunctional lysylphosphatidylglycerol flippase/synthetase MprF [Vitiosangium sp. GDMCC 1.1324]PTL80956.1 bifunctional lysylphosphatidylglycerol flippase/synthetase MprF [Vitiosangium sp. GDMCC 1.1324]
MGVFKHRLLKVAGPLLGVVVLALALKALHEELHAYHYRDIVQQLGLLPLPQVMLAVVLAILSYWVLTGYDWIALRYVGSPLPYRRIAPAAFIATAVSNNVGLTWLSGGSVRFRFYTSQGLSAANVTKVVGYITLSFWVGFLSVGGALFLFDPPPIPPELHLPGASLRLIGALFLTAVLVYAVLVVVRRKPVRIRGWELSIPRRQDLLWQVVVAGGDWFLAAATLYTLLPRHDVSFHVVLGAFIVAQISGLISHVPGGLGVFETVMLLFLSDRVPKPTILGTLLLYRAIYYLLPFAASVALIGVYEVGQRRVHVQRFAVTAGRWGSALLPPVFALATFVAGVFLLISSVTPSLEDRLAWLDRFVPLSVMEASHLLSSLVGASLLLLSRGIQRRLDGAYVLTVAMLVAGIVSALLRGLDVGTALVLALLLACLLPCHREFYRKASLLHEHFTGGWILAIIAAVAATTWLGFFVHRHVELSEDMLLEFVLHGDAPRFLRASVGAAVVVVVFAGAHLLRPLRPQPERPSEADLSTAREIVSRSPRAAAHLALLGDKSLLFNESRTGFVMYAHQGRGWVVVGDPVGPEEELPGLAWRFHEEVDHHDGLTVFYDVGTEHLPLYVDLGLSLQKLGEDARVPLEAYSRDEAAPRTVLEGCHFEVVPVDAVGALLPELKRVSDDWLSHSGHREKGFTIGYFDERYLSQCPIALVRCEGRVVAFANLWAGEGREELAADLLRFAAEAPPGVMDFLLEHLLPWAHREGYRWFNLGLTPSPGFERDALAPTWSRLGSLLFRHGEHFEDLQALRAFKARFHPNWEPRYLVSPGGMALPFVLADVAVLISRGPEGRWGP